jgi:hypothetical protein
VWIVERHGRPVATITIDTTADPELWHHSNDPDNALYVHRITGWSSPATRPAKGSAPRCSTSPAGKPPRPDEPGSGSNAWATNTKLHDYYRSQGFTHLRTTYYAHRGSGALFQ